MTRLGLLLSAVVLVVSGCSYREVRCTHERLDDKTICLRCVSHNNLSDNESDPAVSCPPKASEQ